MSASTTISSFRSRCTALESAAAAFLVPMPAEVLLACAADATMSDLEALLREGSLVSRGGRISRNPLMAPLGSLPRPGQLLRALEQALSRHGPLTHSDLLEAARLAAAAGHRNMGERIERMVRQALYEGAAEACAERVARLGLAARFLEAARAPMLILFVEAGYEAAVEAMLHPEGDAHVQARIRLRQGSPREVLALLERQRGSPWDHVVMARALVQLGDPSGALALVPSAPWGVGLPDMERVKLRRLALMELGAVDRGSGEPTSRALLSRCERSLRRGDVGEAAPLLAELHALADGDPTLWPRLEHASALAAYYRGDHLQLEATVVRLPPSPARERLTAVLDCCRSRDDAAERRLRALAASGDSRARCLLAELHLDAGAVTEAERCLERVGACEECDDETQLLLRRLAWAQGQPVPEARPTDHACTELRHLLLDVRLALDAGDLALAETRSREALLRLDSLGLGMLAAEAWVLRADLAARLGDPEEALARLRRARGRLPHPRAPLARLIAVAWHALTDTPVTGSLLADLVAHRDVQALALATRELAARPEPSEVLERAVDVLEHTPATLRRLAQASFPVVSSARALLVSDDASRFRPPGTTSWTDLGRRRSQRLVLDELTRVRMEQPGEVLDVDALLAAGWPGEQVVHRAGANRVHVTLSGLRTAGLADVLERTPEGYRLDPGVPVLRVTDTSTGG